MYTNMYTNVYTNMYTNMYTNVYTNVYANYTVYVCAIYICLQLSYWGEAGYVWSTHMSNGREDFTELQNVVITQQVVDVSQGSCTQHEKCHHLYSCIPSTRAWLNCTSTSFMHVACMQSTCTCCAKHTCIRLHGHMHTFSISCRHLDHMI